MNAGIIEALWQTRTADPFLTMEGHACAALCGKREIWLCCGERGGSFGRNRVTISPKTATAWTRGGHENYRHRRDSCPKGTVVTVSQMCTCGARFHADTIPEVWQLMDEHHQAAHTKNAPRVVTPYRVQAPRRARGRTPYNYNRPGGNS